MLTSRLPPSNPQPLTIALFGKRVQLKNIIGNMILGSESYSVTMSDSFVVEKNDSFKIINTPDFFDEGCLNPDQQIIDFMALSQPAPDLFILAVDSDTAEEENVVAQISKLQDTFGENITAHLTVMLPGIESFHSLSHLKKHFNTRLAIANENLANDCKKWCHGRPGFVYDYKNYSEDVVIRRRIALENKRCRGHPPGKAGADPMSLSSSRHAPAAPAGAAHERHIGNSAHGVSDNMFNIVLLGLMGTGKSASANTILAAGNSELDSEELFKSEPSSMPVTTRCEVRIMEKPFGVQVRVVDTPDFFHDQLTHSQAHVEECKRYCQPGHCLVLLVFQLGRITEVEEGILEKLENKLGWRIRESTIVLLTHGEDLEGSLEQFIDLYAPLKNILRLCGNRYHLFKNSSKGTKQVMELIKKIPNCKDFFPKFAKKKQCSVC